MIVIIAVGVVVALHAIGAVFSLLNAKYGD